MEKRFRISLAGVSAIFILSSALIAQTPARPPLPQPTRSVLEQIDDPPRPLTNPEKLATMPDVVSPARSVVATEWATPGAIRIREAFGPGKERLADAFHDTIVEAGFDPQQGEIKRDGESVVYEIKGREGVSTITAAENTDGTLQIRKVLTLPNGLPPVIFTQPRPAPPPTPAPAPLPPPPPTPGIDPGTIRLTPLSGTGDFPTTGASPSPPAGKPQPPAAPAATPPTTSVVDSLGDAPVVPKLGNLPDQAEGFPSDVPTEFAEPGLRAVREAFGPGNENIANGFHDALQDAGVDVTTATVTKGTDYTTRDNVVVTVRGPDGTATITAIPTDDGRVYITKTLTLSNGATVQFNQPRNPQTPAPPAAGTPPSIRLERAGPGTLVLTPPKTTTGAAGNLVVPGVETSTGGAVVLPVNPGPGFPGVFGPSQIIIPVAPGDGPGSPLPPTTPAPTIAIPSITTPTSFSGVIPAFSGAIPAPATATPETAAVTGSTPVIESGRSPVQPAAPANTELEKVPTARDPWAILRQTPGVLVDRVTTGDPPATTGTVAPSTVPSMNTRRGTNEWRDSGRYVIGDDFDDDWLLPLIGSIADVTRPVNQAAADDQSQYLTFTATVTLGTQSRPPFHEVRDALTSFFLRRPGARPLAFASRSVDAGFIKARASESRQAARAAAPFGMLITSLGVSTGEAFRVQAIGQAEGLNAIETNTLVVEPIKGLAATTIERAQKAFDAQGAATAIATGYCLEFLKEPPRAGNLYRIAPREIQKRFEPLRRVVRAADRLRRQGALQPDSDPKSYFDSITQWAAWTRERKFTRDGFREALIDYTKKNLAKRGQPWKKEMEKVFEKIVPHRWLEIQRILQEAGQ